MTEKQYYRQMKNDSNIFALISNFLFSIIKQTSNGATTLSITTFSITTLSIMTFSKTTISIMVLNAVMLNVSAECHLF